LVWFKISGDAHLQLTINVDLLLLQLHGSTTDPAELAAMRGNIPAGCPVSTRDPFPGLSTYIRRTVLSSSDDQEGNNTVRLNFFVNVF
jgi:hypothetical protein